MKEKPILYSTPMVQAILENRKTMTRRTQGLEKVNENPNDWLREGVGVRSMYSTGDINLNYHICFRSTKDGESVSVKPRYYVGDHIWVKESYYAYGYWVETGKLTKTCKIQYTFIDLTVKRNHKYMYEHESEEPNRVLNDNAVKDGIYGWFKRPSLFMPKKNARIWLECTNVRCERLHSISEADAIAEGIDYKIGFALCKNPERNMCQEPLTESFLLLWKKLNGEESVALNPWVFIYEFKRIEKPCQQPQN